MKFPETLTVRVAHVETLTPLIKQFTLVAGVAQALPGFSAGSHVLVHLRDGDRIYRNAYSLLGSPYDRKTYRIAVRRQAQSRGGSVYMHEHVQTGDLLQINPPANLFPIDRLATRHILIAGGIGITPLMSHVAALAQQETPYELHYAYRAVEHAAFGAHLATALGQRLHTYDTSKSQRLRPSAVLAAQPLGTHVYVCGPQGLIDAVIDEAGQLGWPDSHVHYEQFAAPLPGKPFRVHCARQRREIDVPGDTSLLDALEAAGIAVPHMCRGGVCGQCETTLLEGEAEHRDSYLPEAARTTRIMPCVSRARDDRLVLDL